MADIRRPYFRGLTLAVSFLALGACANGIDLDLRNIAGGLDTTEASRQPTEKRPKPDDRGVISYPTFDVAVAKRGDTVQTVATRVGMNAAELARHNGLAVDTKLRIGEVVALPRRVGVGGATETGLPPTEEVDITTLAGDALNRIDDTPTTSAIPPVQSGPEPVRHQVVRGETAYTIARLYDVSVRSLADWNGLGADLSVREGQFLLIPVAKDAPVETTPAPEPEYLPVTTSVPGEGTIAPEPPSASTPLPEPEPEPELVAVPTLDGDAETVETPVTPVTPAPERTSASASRLSMPLQGAVIRDYKKGENDGIDIAASPGDAVKAAGAGTVAAITRDVDGVPILVIRHSGNLLTVYANIDDLSVAKGDSVSKGQSIAQVRGTAPGFLHFEVREGFDSVDPIDYLN